MHIGDTVMIYEKPLTEEQPEGEAILVEQLSTSRHEYSKGRELQQWTVVFDDNIEAEAYTRFILADSPVIN